MENISFYRCNGNSVVFWCLGWFAVLFVCSHNSVLLMFLCLHQTPEHGFRKYFIWIIHFIESSVKRLNVSYIAHCAIFQMYTMCRLSFVDLVPKFYEILYTQLTWLLIWFLTRFRLPLHFHFVCILLRVVSCVVNNSNSNSFYFTKMVNFNFVA